MPLFLVLGYVVRVIRRTSTGDDEAPVFEDWAELGYTGAKAFVIRFACGLVPALLAAVVVGFGVVGAPSGSESAMAAGGLVVFVGVLFAPVLGLVVAYLPPAALANFAEKNAIGAGFAFEEL